MIFYIGHCISYISLARARRDTNMHWKSKSHDRAAYSWTMGLGRHDTSVNSALLLPFPRAEYPQKHLFILFFCFYQTHRAAQSLKWPFSPWQQVMKLNEWKSSIVWVICKDEQKQFLLEENLFRISGEWNISPFFSPKTLQLTI